MDSNELKTPTKEFALRVMRLVGALPKDSVGRAIGNQLIRSGTSVGANCRAACRGRSKAEFLSKLSIVIEEAGESCYWMEFIIQGEHLPQEKVASLLTKPIKSQQSWLRPAKPPKANKNKSSILNQKSSIIYKSSIFNLRS